MPRNACAAMAIALTMVFGSADAQPRHVQLGTLTCSMSASIGLIVGSQKNVNCVFRGQAGEPDEAYTGTMTTVGLDIGFTSGGVIVWTVFADSSRIAGMLTGRLSARPPKSRSRPVSAPMCWSVVQTARSHCNRSPCRARSASTLLPALANSTCIRPDLARPGRSPGAIVSNRTLRFIVGTCRPAWPGKSGQAPLGIRSPRNFGH
jgi:Protein of unknown function (DUF992)